MNKLKEIMSGGMLIGFCMTSPMATYAADSSTEKKVCPIHYKTKIKYVYVQPRSNIRRTKFYRYRRPYVGYPYYAYPAATYPYEHVAGYPSLHSVAIHHSNHPYGFQAAGYNPYQNSNLYNPNFYGSYNPNHLYQPAYLNLPYGSSPYIPPAQPFNIYNQY